MTEEQSRIDNVRSVVFALTGVERAASDVVGAGARSVDDDGDVIEDRCVGVLLTAVCGDALGSNLEFKSMRDIERVRRDETARCDADDDACVRA